MTDKEIVAWADAVFGYPDSKVRVFMRCLEEFAELGTAIEKYDLDPSGATERAMKGEHADVRIALVRLAHEIGADPGDVDAKMLTNLDRWWHRDGTGHGYHCKGEGCQKCKASLAVYRARPLPGGGWEVETRGAHEEKMAAMLGEPKTTDYCARCGESPDSATHVMHDSQGGHDYVDPRADQVKCARCGWGLIAGAKPGEMCAKCGEEWRRAATPPIDAIDDAIASAKSDPNKLSKIISSLDLLTGVDVDRKAQKMVDEAQKEIELLKERLYQMDRRIAELERTLARRKPARRRKVRRKVRR